MTLQKNAWFKLLKLSLISTFVFLLYHQLDRFCHKQTDGFTVLKISSKRPFNQTWTTRQLSGEEQREFEMAVSQKYSYFGCGGQCFVFFSEDGKYIIKFFKQRRYNQPFYLRLIPFLSDFKRKKSRGFKEKLRREFHSYKMAFEDLKNETGVVFVHLNPTKDLNKSVTIVDPLGCSHQLYLDKFDFIIQKRAEMVEEKIKRLLLEGNYPAIQQSIRSMLDMILTRCKKGYHDTDPNILTNCGFLADQAVKIDIGHFVPKETMKNSSMYKKALLESALPFREWLGETSPSLVSCFDHAIFELLENDEKLSE